MVFVSEKASQGRSVRMLIYRHTRNKLVTKPIFTPNFFSAHAVCMSKPKGNLASINRNGMFSGEGYRIPKTLADTG